MKVAVSIPDAVFQRAERLVGHMATSRSDLYARAVKAFVDTHEPDRITAAMNAVIDDVGSDVDPFVDRAGRETLARTEW